MAKTLSIVTNGNKGGLPVQNAGLKLSKIIAIDKIEEHEKFRELYSIDDDLLERIAEDMKANKFDASQPVHIWLCNDEDGTEHFYLIDGYTRIKAAKMASLPTVPYFEHSFASFEEAHRYALHLQVDRRNLSGMDLLRNIEELMGSDYIQSMRGNKNAAIGEMLGVSEKTVERAKFVEKNASEEQMEAIESGEATINSTYDEIKAEQKKEKADRQPPVQDDDSDFDSFDDISDALEDNSDQPKGLVISDHSDHIERPTNKLSPKEDSERTKERRKAYELGFEEGFHNALVFALAETSNGKTIHQIWNDERIRNLKKRCDFKLPNGYEEMVSDWWYDDDSESWIENDTQQGNDDSEPSDAADETNASDSEDAPDGSSGGITPDIEIEGE